MPYWDTPTGGATLRMTVTLLSQNVAANTSRIRRQLDIIGVGSLTSRADPVSCQITGAGATASGDFTWAKGTSSKTILSSDTTVTHDADGKLRLTITGSIGATGTSGIGGPTTNGPRTWDLPTIPRASSASFGGGSTFDAGSPVSISISRASSDFTHDLSYWFGDLGPVSIIKGVATSTSWTPPLSLLQQIPDAVSGAGFVRVYTNDGSTFIGYKDMPFTLRAPASAVPTVTALTAADQNPDVVSIVGKYVQGLSRAKLTVTGQGYQGSTITAASATLLGSTVASGGTIAVTGSGALPVTGKVTDSRGRTGSTSGTLDVLPYSPPKATAYQARRCTFAGVVDDEGEYLRVDLTAAISSLINSTERNELTIRAFTRPHTTAGTGAWTARNVLTPGGTTYDASFVVSGGGIYDTTGSWDVRVQVHDRFGVYVADTTVSTITVTMDMNGANVGIGKIWEQGALDVGGQIFQNGLPVIDSGDVASTSARGVVELATVTEAQTGTDATRAVTPAGLEGLILRVGSAEASSGDQSGITTTATEITGTSVSFTLAAAGTVVFTGVLSTYSTSAGDVIAVQVRDGTTVLREYTRSANSAPAASGTTRTHVMAGDLSLGSGSHRLNLAVVRVAGGGSVTVTKATARPSRLAVDRII